MSTRKATIALVAFALAAGLACEEGDGVGTQPGHDPEPNKQNTTAPAVDRPNCPRIEWRAPEERCFTLQSFVETRLGPYDVYLKIEGGNGVYPKEIPQSGGGWSHSIVYATGKQLKITLTVHYEGEQSRDGFCSITDGGELVKNKLRSITAGGGSPYEAVCVLTTSQ